MMNGISRKQLPAQRLNLNYHTSVLVHVDFRNSICSDQQPAMTDKCALSTDMTGM